MKSALMPSMPKVGAHRPTKIPTSLACCSLSYPKTIVPKTKASTAINIEPIIIKYQLLELILTPI